MALRLANQINRQLVKNVCRSLSAKREPELEQIIQKVEEVPKSIDVSSTAFPLNGARISSQYEVCRPRTTPVTPFPHTIQNETDAAKKTVALQHLQPAMLPEYYKPPVEINAACMYFDPITETDRQSTTKYRQFEQSKTCKNVTLPLRTPKLASPFPDPVKVMQSHTVSDQEKAEQMLAESKIMKGHSNKNKNNRQSMIRSLPPARSYSTSDSKECKKIKKVEGKKCTKIKVPGCRPVKSIRCGRAKKERPVCLKKPSPYPSYSETCHEDPYNKPSECKICPYRPDDHPYFKPPKSDFHTTTTLPAKRRDECVEPFSQQKKPCAYPEEKQKGKHQQQQQQQKQKQHQQQQKPKPKKRAVANLQGDLQSHQYSAFNFRTKNFPFFPPKAKEYEEQAEVQTNQDKSMSPKTKHLSGMTLDKEMGTGLNRLHPQDDWLGGSLIRFSEAESEDKGKCKKFPFKECTFNIVKKREGRPPTNQKCPPKPKRKLLNDCPPEQEEIDRCKKTSPMMNDVLTYFMADESGTVDEKAKKKCPRVNLGVCKDPNEYTDDPCKRKKTGKTLICPSDLLSKKPKPKKKSSPVFPLAQMQSVSKSETAIKI